MGHARTSPRQAGPAQETQQAVRRYLLYGLLPGWFIPGLLDWHLHRRTKIEETSGLRESLIHALMMAEVGIPVLGALALQVNRRLMLIMGAAAVTHEVTAAWDVRTAHDSTREVRPSEQHVHSFLETLPFTTLAAVACLHWDELRHPNPHNQGLRRKQPPLPKGYVLGILTAVGALIGVPYGEELVRCWRHRGTASDA